MITPPALKIGDKVAFIAPARKVAKAELAKATAVLESWGLAVVFPEGLFLENNQFAGTDAQRVNHIQWCFDNSEIKAVFCVRGGYGTSRIIDTLEFSILKKNPKWLVGFSDVTVLLNRMYNEGIETIHGPVALLLHQNQEAQQKLKQLLFGENVGLSAPYHSLNQLGKTKGKVVGGNLSVLVNQIGTTSFPDLRGSLLFIEDLDEYLYHIDRMMVQLDRTGVFGQVNGLIVGYMSGMHDNKIPFGHTAYEIISSISQKYNLPVAYDFPIGHENNNQALIVGRTMCLEITVQKSILSKNFCG